jgi:eukaryotic-like serine/threonine-protein kinase
MNVDRALEQVLEQLADGAPIDWTAVEKDAGSPSEIELIRQLRVLEGLGETHRSAPLAADGESTHVVKAMAATATDLAASEGRRWGRYHLVRHIGQGSYGVVFLGRDEDLDRDVAVKLLHQRPLGGGDLASRVKSEGRALARVRHTNVVTVYDVEEHENQLGLCMEYIHGRTLDDIVRADGPMGADQAAVDGQAVCRALAAIHAVGILHRDVKARNVMRERGGRIVLMDLGAGRDQETLRGPSATTNIGTPLYMAPELLLGGTATRQTDVYAVGVLLYFLVTGSYPVVGSSIDEIRQLHRSGKRTPLDDRRPELPDAFVRVVERATAVVASERHDSAMALLRDLNVAIGGSAEAMSGSTHVDVVRPRRTFVEWVRLIVLVAGAIVGLSLASGLLTTWAFNAVVDRPAAFDHDTLAEKFVVGLRTLVVPAFNTAILVGIGGVVGVVLRLLPWSRRLWKRLASAPATGGGWTPQERLTAASLGAVVVGFAGLAVVLIAFGDVFILMLSSLGTGRLDVFAPLLPDRAAQVHRVNYRMIVPAMLLVVMMAWAGVRRLRQAIGGDVPGWSRGAGIATASVLLIMSQAPYKLMLHNSVPVVLIDGARCYLLGQAGAQARVFCPTSDLPRVRTVQAPVRIEACGFEENVFLASSAPGCVRDAQP